MPPYKFHAYLAPFDSPGKKAGLSAFANLSYSSRSRLRCTMQTANDSHILLAPKLVAQDYGRNEQATEWCWPYTLWLEELVNQD